MPRPAAEKTVWGNAADRLEAIPQTAFAVAGLGSSHSDCEARTDHNAKPGRNPGRPLLFGLRRPSHQHDDAKVRVIEIVRLVGLDAAAGLLQLNGLIAVGERQVKIQA